MRPTLPTILLLLFATGFFGYAYLLSSTVSVSAGLGVLVFVFYRAYHFGNLMQDVMQNISINREVNLVYLRQGTDVSVKAFLTLPEIENVSVNVRDLAPDGSHVTEGSTDFINGSAIYSIQVMMLGTTGFGGVEVTLKDPFFTEKLRLSKNMREPKLKTYPTGVSATLLNKDYTSKVSSVEQERLSVITKGDVRYFRPYRAGDSYKDIDWKLSAKYDDLMVKEHMDATGVNPLMVIDLPETGTVPEDVLSFTETVTGTMDTLNKNGGCLVAFISGGNLIGMDHSENNKGIYDYLKTAGKVHRPFHQFRFRHIGSLRNEVMILGDFEDIFSGKLHDVIESHLSRHMTPYEESMLHLIAADNSLTDLVLVTTAKGDISHLTGVITEAKLQRKNVSVILPKKIWEENSLKIQRVFRLAGVDYVELV